MGSFNGASSGQIGQWQPFAIFNFASKEHYATGQQRFHSLPGPLATKASRCVVVHFSLLSALMTFALS